MKQPELHSLLREIVQEVLDEMTGTGAVAGYQTPFAFQGKGDAARKRKIAADSMPGGKVVGEGEPDAETEESLLVRRSLSEQIDMRGKPCKKCKKGTYQETSQFDDMDGVVHCTKCGHPVKRWVENLSEARSRYLNYRDSDVMKTHAKVSYGIKEAHSMLREVEFLVGLCERLKLESGTSNDQLWKRTAVDVSRIHQRLKEIARRVSRLSK